MKANYIQNKNGKNITHVDCEYLVAEVSDLGNGEVLSTVKIKNKDGEYVGLSSFAFIYSLHDINQDAETRRLEVNKQASTELHKNLTR
tara:strand:+ start:852 stop:1115 length:264 start_codon:yes stop_codon:yes gene_type:complete